MTIDTTNPVPGTRTSALAARAWTVALGLILALAGLGTCSYLWKAYQKARTFDDWARVPCEIIASSIDDSGRSQHGMVRYELKVSYRYEFNGEPYVSNRIRRLGITSLSDREIEKKARAYPPGLETTCLVNPADPGQAVLKADSKAALYTMWFPGIFVVGGVGIMLAGLLGRRRKRAAT